ncbi:hypothetical protein RRG08_052555 [Elysia crispata]|uniref:Uncharacterized protein n=1 Tax=Elysia crispata TaxID=231223 RepID=A0AAE0Z5R1_9GAST|nr:hypothetical protein RRG08_052555 [Elysia crispata]
MAQYDILLDHNVKKSLNIAKLTRKEQDGMTAAVNGTAEECIDLSCAAATTERYLPGFFTRPAVLLILRLQPAPPTSRQFVWPSMGGTFYTTRVLTRECIPGADHTIVRAEVLTLVSSHYALLGARVMTTEAGYIACLSSLIIT